MPLDDKGLVRAFQAGDEFAFVSLYNRYKGAVYAFCLKMLLDEAAAQDVLQETFLRAYENRSRLTQAGSFRSWLFTIARNQCLNQIRRNKKHVMLSALEPHPTLLADSDTPFGRLEKNERVDLVNRFLHELSPSYREVLVLREYQNLSYEEIAAVTRNTVSSVKSRLFKARRKLRDFLKPWMQASEKEKVSVPGKSPKGSAL